MKRLCVYAAQETDALHELLSEGGDLGAFLLGGARVPNRSPVRVGGLRHGREVVLILFAETDLELLGPPCGVPATPTPIRRGVAMQTGRDER